ncbi:uncharacterized protein LOC124848127 [Vigna umbellata]|uniref:uncharacterized protein LOC124848127 n=1 Tax=Vigna umbellata TaxID=87088 RepID=UPI001F5F166A|nr:uncharacterized protein LOC124848127 [Vigna umbellata]
MRAWKNGITDQYVVDKILRTLTPRFDHVVMVIEETRDLETLEIEELQHSLEAHEYRINERRHCKEQVLQTRSQFKGKERFKKGGKGGTKQKESQEQHSEDSSDYVKGKKKKKSCTNSDGEKEGKFDNQKKSDDAIWYLDSDCSTHMIGKKEWFVKLKEVMQGRIKFVDDRSLAAEGTGRVVLRDGDGREVVIDEVLYVPGLKTNLLSLDLSQLSQREMVKGLPMVEIHEETETPGDSRYLLLFVDDWTRKCWTYLLSRKSEVLKF